MRRAIVDQLEMLKERFLDLPARLVAELAAMDDAHEIHLLLERAIRDALADVRIRVAGETFADGADADGV